MKRFLRLTVLLIVCQLHATPFETISDVKKYAKSLTENIKPDNNDWLRPDFSSFYRKRIPSWWSRVASRLKGGQEWTFKGFEQLLTQVNQNRKHELVGTAFGEKLTPKKDDTFYIWGDLFSAFHSLVRDLEYLYEQGIIDEKFIIKDPSHYFVFNGDVIDGSAYVLDTLTLVLRLMANNPQQVIYTRGYTEKEERWHNYEMMREIKVRSVSYEKGSQQINKLIDTFFYSLPSGLFLTQEKDDQIDVVVLSSNDKISERFDQNILGKLPDSTQDRGFFPFAIVRQKLKKKMVFKAFITGEDRSVSYHISNGLARIGAIEGASRWMVFSSPTQRNQTLYKFDFDAFAQLNIANGMDAWTIDLVNRKVGTDEPFKQAATYNLISGVKISKDFQAQDDKEFYFGATMDLSKSASPIGKKVREGLLTTFQKARDNREVPGVTPQLSIVDDEYTPQKTRTAVENLVNKGINIMIGSQGSPSLEAYLDLVKEGKVLVLFPFTGAPIFRKPDLTHLIHYRGSYIKEGQELIRYALKNLRSKKIAIFYQDDSFGRGALEGAIRALKAAGVTSYIAVPHERNTTDYKQQIDKIVAFNPDTILFSSVSLAIRSLIRQMGVQYFAGKKLLGLSVYEDAFERFLRDKGLQFTIIRMVPDPATSKLEIAKEYRALMDKNNLSYDKLSFEDFINASILFEILRKIDGPITHEKIIKTAEGFKKYPFKGLVLDFNPETRELSDTLWIDTGVGPWIPIKRTDIEAQEKQEEKEGWQIGSILDLSGGTKGLGRGVKQGIELRLEKAREEGMKPLPVITIVDDGYEPARTRKEVEAFIKTGIRTFLSPSGSPTLMSYLDLVELGDVTVLFPVTGSPLFRNPKLRNIINLRSSYFNEGEVLADYALNSMSGKKIVALYQDDAFGKGLMDGARSVLQRNNASFIELSYKRHQTLFDRQVAEVAKFKPDTILFLSTATVAKDFIRQYGIRKMVSIHILGNSDLGEAHFIDYARDLGLKFVYVNAVPNPKTSLLPIVQQYRQASDKIGKSYDTFALEGYIATDLLLHVTRPMGENITREKIVDALMQIKNQEYKGLMLNFNPANRTLLHSLWLDTGKPDWVMVSTIKNNKTAPPAA